MTGSFFASVIITVTGLACREILVDFLCSNASIRPYVKEYVVITLIGALPKIMIYVPFWYLRLDGKNAAVTVMMSVMSVGNIILDVLFVYIWDMGVFGAGLASVLATLAAFAIGLIRLFANDCSFAFSLAIHKNARHWKSSAIAGTPSALNNLFSTIRLLMINSLLMRDGGGTAVAVFTAVNGIAGFFFLLCMAGADIIQSMYGLSVPLRYLLMDLSLEKSGNVLNFSVSSDAEEICSASEEVCEVYETGEKPEGYFVRQSEKYGYLTSSIMAVRDDNGNMAALLFVDIHMEVIVSTLVSYVLRAALICSGLLVLFCVFYWFLLKRILLKPIAIIRQNAFDFANNDAQLTDTLEQIQTGDELQELDIATHIQSSMLPCIFPAFPDRKEFDIYASMNPAKEVGGDFYDFFMVDDRHLAIVMADVSGKGVPAALFMVIGKTLIKDHTQPGVSLGAVFSDVNNLLCASNSEGVLTLEPGDKIFQYTDGVTEATNEQNELYGMKRLDAVLNKNGERLPDEIIAAVKEDIDSFVGDASQFDDITMLCLEYKERMEEN